jgi:DNA (cytosine-5)-methyltransferase 1
VPTDGVDATAESGRATHRFRVLDLFCGVGGAARGLQELGYEVVGFDVEHQPKYPGEFHQRDLTEGLPAWVLDEQWAGVWASPPCTPFTEIEAFQSGENLIPLARDLVTAVPWAGFRIIENVRGASDWLRDPTRLQGGAFGLEVEKERVFETNFRAASQTVSGVSYAYCIGDREHPVKGYRQAHGFPIHCDLGAKDLREAIPPAYVRHLVEEYGRTGESRQGVLA